MPRFKTGQSNKESKTHAKLMRDVKESKQEMRDNAKRNKK